jgi:hypothetical protein
LSAAKPTEPDPHGLDLDGFRQAQPILRLLGLLDEGAHLVLGARGRHALADHGKRARRRLQHVESVLDVLRQRLVLARLILTAVEAAQQHPGVAGDGITPTGILFDYFAGAVGQEAK